MWPITHDPWPTWPMTHDQWSLHHFILRMGLGGVWHGGTGQPCRSSEQKKSYIKVKPPTMIIGLIEWVSSFLMPTKNKKSQVTAQLFHNHGSTGSDPWPTWPIQKWWPMTYWPISISGLVYLGHLDCYIFVIVVIKLLTADETFDKPAFFRYKLRYSVKYRY